MSVLPIHEVSKHGDEERRYVDFLCGSVEWGRHVVL